MAIVGARGTGRLHRATWSHTSSATIPRDASSGRLGYVTLDTHIEIVASLDDAAPTKQLIIEVTPRMRAMAATKGKVNRSSSGSKGTSGEDHRLDAV